MWAHPSITAEATFLGKQGGGTTLLKATHTLSPAVVHSGDSSHRGNSRACKNFRAEVLFEQQKTELNKLQSLDSMKHYTVMKKNGTNFYIET